MKEREVPQDLKILRVLNPRMILTQKEETHLANLEKGFIGECFFDEKIKAYDSGDCIILHDILLKLNGSLFQIDTLVITPQPLFI
jgi:hypothetical protein